MNAPASKLHVLLVDDSALVRDVMTQIVEAEKDMRITTAMDPIMAMEKLAKDPPDVVVLDIEMPHMDGLTFLRKIMAERPMPVVICSSLTATDKTLAVQAIEEGAIEVINKRQLKVWDFFKESAGHIVDVIRGAALARGRVKKTQSPEPPVGAPPPPKAPLRITTDKVIAVGASTGGTEAIRQVLMAMPPESPGIVIVQHMPEVFTAAFAERLNTLCAIEVKEAEDGDRVLNGRALIAPGNFHMMLQASGGHYVVRVKNGPLVSRHRPSVDVLFSSVAENAGANAVGVIMTGMGDDGARGLLEMKEAGAHTIAQDEASSVVFGMPKEAIRRGAVHEIVPLSVLGATILRRHAALSR